jgi:hypothetical protein
VRAATLRTVLLVIFDAGVQGGKNRGLTEAEARSVVLSSLPALCGLIARVAPSVDLENPDALVTEAELLAINDAFAVDIAIAEGPRNQG